MEIENIFGLRRMNKVLHGAVYIQSQSNLGRIRITSKGSGARISASDSLD